jgi:FdhD protein
VSPAAAGGSSAPAAVVEVQGGARRRAREDLVAVEAPLEIRVRGAEGERSLTITMRTPGEDEDLAIGFLFTEGVVQDAAEVLAVSGGEDLVVVELAPAALARAAAAERAFATTSACGVCGKGSLATLRATPRSALAPGRPRLDPGVVHALPAALRAAQAGFAATGGVHAAGLFGGRGTLLVSREDVGRHNAVDKLVGALVRQAKLPAAAEALLLVSGRASFELVQKALMAGIPVLAAVGAPSSLAVTLAAEAGMTLLGFVREGRFNVYGGGERLSLEG